MANNNRTRRLTESAILVALSTVLSMVILWHSPYGGSVTALSMVPLILLSLRWGTKAALPATFVYSLIQLFQGLGNLSYIPTPAGVVLAALLDYLLPFTALALAGTFRKLPFPGSDTTKRLLQAGLGAAAVCCLRYLCHIGSGTAVWYALDLVWYADDPSHIVNHYGPLVFSVIYNGIFMVPEILATTLGTVLLCRIPRLVRS